MKALVIGATGAVGKDLVEQLLTGDVLFSCLGTTIKAAGSQEALNAIGLMRSWKPMPTEEVAQAMIRLAKADLSGTRTYDLKSKL